jgi:hypothetical protein
MKMTPQTLLLILRAREFTSSQTGTGRMNSLYSNSTRLSNSGKEGGKATTIPMRMRPEFLHGNAQSRSYQQIAANDAAPHVIHGE